MHDKTHTRESSRTSGCMEPSHRKVFKKGILILPPSSRDSQLTTQIGAHPSQKQG